LYKIKNQVINGAETKNTFFPAHYPPELLPAKFNNLDNPTDIMSNVVTVKITG